MEIELRRKALMDKLLELEKNPSNKKKGYLKQIYFEVFGGVPSELVDSERLNTGENDEEDSPEIKPNNKGEKSGGFFKAIKGIFKTSKQEPKLGEVAKKAGQLQVPNLSKSVMFTSPDEIYENDIGPLSGRSKGPNSARKDDRKNVLNNSQM